MPEERLQELLDLKTGYNSNSNTLNFLNYFILDLSFRFVSYFLNYNTFIFDN